MRCLAFRSGAHARLLSRNQKPLSSTFPELLEALEQQPCHDFIVDGEIVAFAPGRQVTSFSQIQQRLGIHDASRARSLQRRYPVHLFLFDILHLHGHDTTALPLVERKQLLKQAIRFAGPIHFSEHLEERGERFLAEACKQGWEGLVAKRAASRYTHARSRDWLKFKCVHEQEFVIGGYTDPQQSRIGFGSLLVGYHDETGRLLYAGRVGTGYTDQMLRDLHARLSKLKQKNSPFADDVPSRYARTAHWVKPRLVAQVGFTEWTKDGRLRHPRFHHLRTDKAARDVIRESPVRRKR